MLSPDYVKRMFPVKDAKWQGKVHESVVTELPVIKLKGYIKHYTYKDFEQYISKMNAYSSIWAENSNKNQALLKILYSAGFCLYKNVCNTVRIFGRLAGICISCKL